MKAITTKYLPATNTKGARRDPLDLERAAFWGELARAVAILGPIVALTEIGVWLLW